MPLCNPFYHVLIGPPTHWSPNVTLGTQFSVVLHLSGPSGYIVCIVGLGDKPFHPMNNLVMEKRACDANACISLNAMRMHACNANARISSNANTCISMLGECAHWHKWMRSSSMCWVNEDIYIYIYICLLQTILRERESVCVCVCRAAV